MWVNTSLSTFLLAGSLIPSPIQLFCAAGSFIYGAIRLTAGESIDNSINNNIGYRK